MSRHGESIAIVGIGCQFAGGISDAETFWRFVKKPGDAVVDVPEDRWDLDQFYDDDERAPGKMFVRRAAFLTRDIYEFDAGFFGISPREARTMDPQQRLLLETAFEAFENAGMKLEELRGSKTGVFMGGFMMDNFVLRTSRESLPAGSATKGPVRFRVAAEAKRWGYRQSVEPQ